MTVRELSTTIPSYSKNMVVKFITQNNIMNVIGVIFMPHLFNKSVLAAPY